LSSIPSSLSNPGPPYHAALTLPSGPKRLTDDRELSRFHIPPGPFAPVRPGRFSNLATARRILVVRLDFVGDWILTTPFLDELRARAPRAEITAVVIDRAFAFADADPAVDRVISTTAARGRRVTVGASSVKALAGFIADYRKQRFDLALVPRWDVDFNGAAMVAYGSGAPRVVGFAETSTGTKTVTNRGDDRFYTDVVEDRANLHEAERMLTLFGAIGVRDWRERPVRAVSTAADETAAAAIMADKFTRPVLAVAPFVDQGRRTLPAPLLMPMIDRLQGRFDMDVAVIAAPIHAGRAARFAADLSGHAVSLAGRLTLRETAAFMRRCAAAVTMDSGPAHIAAGVGLPVAVFSCHPADGDPGHPQSPVRFAPRTAAGLSLVLQPRTALPPCLDGCSMDEAHCITQLGDARAMRRLEDFMAGILGTIPAPVVEPA